MKVEKKFKVNRRQFTSLSILIFAPYLKGNATQSSFGFLLDRIKNPFKLLNIKESYNLDDWINELPITSDISVLSEYVLSLIKQDYKENRVELVEGIILSKTEIKLYLAKEFHA